jgi:anti-sigma regulatory factor (Ser/Thr protein kinase)
MGEVYKGEPGDIAAARRFATELLGHLKGADTPVPGTVVADVKLVVSELVTNAVQHTEGPCGLDLRVAEDTVEITVWDTSARGVTAMAADPARVGRHGLEIVKTLCGGFDMTATPTGKQLTVRMGLRSAA